MAFNTQEPVEAQRSQRSHMKPPARNEGESSSVSSPSVFASSTKAPLRTNSGRKVKSDAAQDGLAFLCKRSRFTWVITTTLLTIGVFSLDKLLSEWSLEKGISSLLDDYSLIFYFIGIVAGYNFFRRAQLSRQEKLQDKKSCAANSPTLASATPTRATRLPSFCMGQDDCSHRGFASPDSVSSTPSSQVSGRPGTSSRLNHLLNQAAAKDQALTAARTLTRLESEGWESDTTSYTIVIRALAKSGKLQQAEHWLAKLFQRGLQPNEHIYAALMNASMKADEAETVEYWMKKMQQSGVMASNISYGLLIHAYTRSGNLAKAESWLRTMEEEGITPHDGNYNSLIHACSMQCNAGLAEQWLEEMLRKGLEPSVVTYTALIDACAKSSDVQRAESWMADMLARGVEPNVVSFGTMINACAKVGELARAEHWYEQMKEKGVQPNEYVYSGLINACAKAGDVEAARRWLERAEQAGSAVDSVGYGCVINACGRVGDAEGAMNVFRRMRSHGIRSHIIIYSSLARPFAYRGDWQMVEQIAEDMKQDGFEICDYFLYAMLLAYSRAKPRQSERAEAAVIKALDSGLQLNERVFKALSLAVGRQRALELAGLYGNSPASALTRTSSGGGGGGSKSTRKTT
eukprot:TRINITY_DN10186_c0_g1_i1.p1 TRINITY_DN10186_c0_g1~~TRINITY_DN10186_c0_g1_i1.p1  ORF type:complete len:632 (-),score=130.51 TRINITY_DN10186_c0_g1_i1:81-1976(-)